MKNIYYFYYFYFFIKGPSKAFSGLTWALYEDSGWYIVNSTDADKMQFGYNKGCDFYDNACLSTTNTYSEFCKSRYFLKAVKQKKIIKFNF